ncbi:MAG: hypothetical protein R3E13_12035 [Alphaproteobacteria bacterium]
MKTSAYKTLFFLIPVLGLSACQSLRAPRVNATPESMSSDTLCYRYASSKNEALREEIARRNLNCAAILENDPLYQGR